MPTLKERIAKWLVGEIPTRRVTVYDERFTSHSLSQSLDIDRVASVIEGANDGDPRDLFALYDDLIINDSHVQGQLGLRKLAVLGDPLTILPADKKMDDDKRAADAIQAMIDGYAGWIDSCNFLLNAGLWPVALLEKTFKPSTKKGLKFDLQALAPVSHQLLDYVIGWLRIREVDPITHAILGGFSEPDTMRYVIHRGHLLNAPDYRGGPMRSLVMWWMLKTLSRDWWSRFLDRYGSPFLLGKYDQADDASRSVLQQAFQWATKIGGLVVSKATEVEVVSASASQSADAYAAFQGLCREEISRLILGQTLSSETKALGIGGGASKNQESVRQDIRQFDKLLLGRCLQQQLFAQYLQINELPGRPPRAVWGGESIEEQTALGDLLASLKQAGLQASDEAVSALSERIGIQLERVQAPPALPPGGPGQALALGARSRYFSAAFVKADDANDQISAAGAADLSQAFRGSLAPVRRMIEDSTSAADLERRILSSYQDWSVAKVGGLIEAALVAYAANGAAR